MVHLVSPSLLPPPSVSLATDLLNKACLGFRVLAWLFKRPGAVLPCSLLLTCDIVLPVIRYQEASFTPTSITMRNKGDSPLAQPILDKASVEIYQDATGIALGNDDDRQILLPTKVGQLDTMVVLIGRSPSPSPLDNGTQPDRPSRLDVWYLIRSTREALVAIRFRLSDKKEDQA